MSLLYMDGQVPGNDNHAVEGAENAASYDRNLRGLAKYLLSSYNNSPTFLIDIARATAKFAKRTRFAGPRIKRVMDIVEYGTPAVVLTSHLASKIRRFHRVTTEKPNVYNEKEVKVRRLLGCRDPEKGDDKVFVSANFDLGKDICLWISGKPKTTEFAIEGFYKDDLQSARDMWDVEHGNVFVLINFEGRRFVWELSYLKFDDKLTITASTIFYLSSMVLGADPGMPAPAEDEESAVDAARERLKSAVFKDFLRHFDVSNNVIHISRGLRSRRRMTFGERINQYDIASFSAEVRKVLRRGRKRGYAFVGVPGTGKSTIIRKLEDSLRDFPMVYLSADNFGVPWEIKETFKTISYMQPCIVVLEDLDSYRFDEKNERLGVFLDCIDDVNRSLNAVFIATINDTKLVHYTLISRPGRLDQVILIKPPQTAEEAYEVMEARFGKIVSSDESIRPEFPAIGDVDADIFDSVIGNGMTQADICELVEKAVLLSDEVTNESLSAAVESILMSKRAIQVCNFGGNDPYEASKTDEKTAEGVVGRLRLAGSTTVVSGGVRSRNVKLSAVPHGGGGNGRVRSRRGRAKVGRV